MQFEEAIDIISELFRIKQWTADGAGERHAIIDDDLEIKVFQENLDNIVLQGVFGDVMSGPSQISMNEAKLKYLLQANFIRLIHQNDVLSIDAKTDRLCTTRQIAIDKITTDELLDEVENFVQNIDFWDVTAKRKRSSSMSPLLGLLR